MVNSWNSFSSLGNDVPQEDISRLELERAISESDDNEKTNSDCEITSKKSSVPSTVDSLGIEVFSRGISGTPSIPGAIEGLNHNTEADEIQEKYILKRKRDNRKTSSPEVPKLSTTIIDLNDKEIESDATIDESPAKKRKNYVRKGREWAMFKPTKKDSLYYKIINNLENVNEEVEDWINIYKTNYQKAVYRFLQFAVDICGYQNFDITTTFSIEVENFQDIISALRKNLTKEHYKGQFLFKGTSKWATKTQTGICKFFIKLMEGLDQENLLFSDCDKFIKHIFIIFVSFTRTNLRAAFYTGSIIVSKMCSVCLRIKEGLQNMDMETQPELSNNQICIKKYIKLFLKIIKSVWFDDNLLMGMKLAILKEMGKWFKLNSLVVKNFMKDLLYILMDSVVSRRLEIRSSALITCELLIKLQNFQNCVGPMMPDFISVIAGRIDDIDYNIAKSAVELLTEVLNINPKLISADIGQKINSLVYCQFYPLARSSGNFFSQVISIVNTSSVETMKCLVKFHQTLQNTDQLTSFLVESILPWLNEVRDVELIISILLNDNFMEQEDQIVLIEILNNLMRQMITNQCKFVRIQTSIDQIDEEEVQKAIFCFITKFVSLYNKFCTQKYGEVQLLEILLFIDYTEVDVNIFKDDIIEITKRLILNFDGTNNYWETLRIISKFLALVKNFNSNDDAISNEVLALKQTITRIFIQILRKVDQNLFENEDTFTIECNLLYFSVLIRYHDLIPSINLSSFLFQNIFDLEKCLGSRAKMYTVKTCSYYLIWTLKSAITNYASLNSFPEQEFQSIVKYFILHCFHILTDAANTLIHQEIFESLIEFVLKFQKVISNSENMPKDKNISIVFSNSQNVLFMEFAFEILFKNQFSTIKLVKKKQIFHNILTLVDLKAVNIVAVAKLFRYYHEFYEDYGDIFDSYLKALRNVGTSAISGMIVISLINYYLENVSEGVINNCNTYTLFENLLNQFRKFVGHKKKEAMEILKYAILFISRSEDHYSFLFHIKVFSLGLSRMDKRVVVSFLFAKIPKQNEKNVYALDFMKFCKVKIAAEPTSITENEGDN